MGFNNLKANPLKYFNMHSQQENLTQLAKVIQTERFRHRHWLFVCFKMTDET